MNYIRFLFSRNGLFVAVYILIGVYANTAPPHMPSFANVNLATLHSIIQYGISVIFWPLSFWHPTFTVSEWTPHQ